LINNLNNGKLKRSLSTRNLTEINTSKDKDKKDFNSIIDYLKPNKWTTFIEMPIIKKTKLFSNGLNLVSQFISCNELVSLIQESITLINNSFNLVMGISDIVKGAKKNYIYLIIFGALTVIINGINLGIAIKSQINNVKKKQLTKSQKNFNTLITEMIKMFRKLLESNLNDLYKNNIIIFAFYEKKTPIFKSNEGVDLRLANIRELYDYAQCLDLNDIEREKYIQNNIIFLKKVFQKISELNPEPQYKEDEKDNKKDKKSEEIQDKKRLSDIQKATGFLLNTQKEIKENPKYNNKKFWINTNEDSLEEVINDLYDLTLKIYEETNIEN